MKYGITCPTQYVYIQGSNRTDKLFSPQLYPSCPCPSSRFITRSSVFPFVSARFSCHGESTVPPITLSATRPQEY
uniref:Ovule protein n=1 Tax=Ascaris lumbricoides TaxID=6252 RepID=A0A0M3I4C4_ASCLU